MRPGRGLTFTQVAQAGPLTFSPLTPLGATDFEDVDTDHLGGAGLIEVRRVGAPPAR